jgi:hypothetical protein
LRTSIAVLFSFQAGDGVPPSNALGLMTPIGRTHIGGNCFHPAAPIEGVMKNLPNSVAIALWVVGSCWFLAIVGYALGASSDWIFPLMALGVLTGLAEWWHVRKRD